METSASPETECGDQAGETTSCGCWCFNGVCWGWRKRNGRYDLLGKEEQGKEKEEGLLGEKLKTLKEFSEILAGPKWKNFIRRFGLTNKKRRTQPYDPQSYALNFDDGINKDSDSVFPSFSARFANPIGNLGAVSSMEM